MKYKNISEEELKGKVGRDWFAGLTQLGYICRAFKIIRLAYYY